jgi:His-Xaa-Ser system radical SAM maturase HxsB
VSRPAPFNFREFSDGVLISNDYGHFTWLDKRAFRAYAAGETGEKDPAFRELASKGFLADRLDTEALSERWRARNGHLWDASCLHIIVVTRACNMRCVYCHAQAQSGSEWDMSEETAAKVVDRIFETPNRVLTIEFQGGEPLTNFPTVLFIADRARLRSKETKKELRLSLITNMSLMDEAKYREIRKRRIDVCTSLDGPAALHDANRLLLGGSSHRKVVKWWNRLSKDAARPSALLTVTRATLESPEAVVDEYAKRGATGIALRPLNPLGYATSVWERIGYSPEEFLAFYKRATDRILTYNRRGRVFAETTAKVFLTKALAAREPNHMDLRSPCGAGIGQIAYDYDGEVYSCDEGRMLRAMGDDLFHLGNVDAIGPRECATHPTVKTLAQASSLDAQSGCSRCVYKPTCGVCPLLEYVENGDLFTRAPDSRRCRILMGIQDDLFARLRDPKQRRILETWVDGGKENTTSPAGLRHADPATLYQRT